MKFVSAVTALVAALAVGSEAAKPKNKRVSRRELNQRMKNGQFDKATIVKNAKPHSAAAKKRALDEGMTITGNYSVQFQSCFSLTTSYEELFEDGATIGANSTIGPGVTIGAHSMVGMGSVVTKNVAPHAIVLGNPAKLVGIVCRCGEVLARGNVEDLPAAVHQCVCERTVHWTGWAS